MANFDPLDAHDLEHMQSEIAQQSQSLEQLEIDDMKWLMSNRRGRRFIARLLDRAGVWRSSFNTNALQMSFNEGLRNDGLRLLDLMTTHCPDRFLEMLKENKDG